MIVLSSRSYIACAFDLLFPALLEYVHKKLYIYEKDWWNLYVCRYKKDIFHDDIRKKIKPDNASKTVNLHYSR